MCLYMSVRQYGSVDAGGSPHCGSIYKGFSECLLRLGDSISQYAEQEITDPQQLDNICSHWDDFHLCAMAAMLECRLEAQVMWDSLREESKKLRFEGNLYELCSKRKQQSKQDRLTGAALQQHPPVLLPLLTVFLFCLI
ncbi:neuritin-A-like [Protopterus annectens]|uniref:neuritin-A-like n=1 Tax=Protopterus annectens TaxID=7888 RepID=UPI001CFC07FD|nr:neuritin-A-like [Protopterus annectens]